jgi:hypothetical protein
MRKYKSKIIEELMSEITELEYTGTKVKMLLAANIENKFEEKFGILHKARASALLYINHQTYSDYCSGNYNFTIIELVNICIILKCSLKDLFDFS